MTSPQLTRSEGDVTLVDLTWRWRHLGLPNLKVMSSWLTQSEGDVTLVDPIWRWHHLGWPDLKVTSPWLTWSEGDVTLVDPIWRWRHLSWPDLKVKPKNLTRRNKQPGGFFESCNTEKSFKSNDPWYWMHLLFKLTLTRHGNKCILLKSSSLGIMRINYE